jgi:perosamine synthetase
MMDNKSVGQRYLELWPPLPPTIYFRPPVKTLPFPVESHSSSFFARGREALSEGVRSFGLEAGEEILAPAFNCGSEIEALVRANLVVSYYEASEMLEPNEEELDSLVTPKSRALLLLHYLGFPQNCEKWRDWCQSRDLLLIEDCAHVWDADIGGRPLGSFGDMAIYSLIKTFGLPEGGVLVRSSRRPLAPQRPRAQWPIALGKRHLQAMATGSGWIPAAHRNPAGPPRQEVFHSDHALGLDAAHRTSLPIEFLLRRLRPLDAAERRRNNYKYLLQEFSDRVPPPFRALPEGAAPLVFPVETESRSATMEHCRRFGVAARPWWSFLHASLPAKKFPHSVAWRTRFVVLPVHQELSEQHLSRIATAVRGCR